MSKRDSVLVALVIGVWTAVLTLYVGPTYLRPLPLWGQVALAVAGGLIIATIAIYSRRRRRRAASSP
jgi:LPXTG-motif cell wall-anchored protein